MTDEASTTNFESRDKALKDGGGAPRANLVKMWLTAIDAASKDEADWRKEGGEILDIYRTDTQHDDHTAFNILYSNTETLLPALYNSTPVPDIRRRYNDPGVVSKAVADLLERSISYSIDMYDFDGTIRSTIFDACVPGRGTVRVRYKPTSTDDEVTGHDCTVEYVAWKNFRRGPGLVWDDVPWIAFEHFLSREQLVQLDPKKGAKVKLDCTVSGEEKKEDDQSMATGEIFGRARVWEIWDRVEKKVLFIAPSMIDGPITEAEDPYKLTGFFPIPRPLTFLDTPTNLTPVPPYRAYKALAEELNEVTARIRKIVAQIRVKGFYAAAADNLQEIVDADDGDLVPVPGMEMFIAQGGGLDKAIAWWPIEPATKALAQLYEQRELIKQTIYEVCGVADIMRGNTKANETLGAQQIKAQWGSLRVQRAQAEVARFIRDIFRIKAELIATFYDMPLLTKMTGVQLYSQNDKALAQQQVQMMQMQVQQATPLTQPAGTEQGGAVPPAAPPPIPEELQKVLEGPSMEEVEQLLRDDVMRSYRVDVESDSTIRADLTRNQESMNGFIQGTAEYIQAVAPAVMSQLMPKDLAVDIYAAFARSFKLGKQVEDSLEKAASNAREMAQKPEPEKPDPEMAKVEADAKANEMKLQSDIQIKQAELQMKQEEMQAELQMKQQELEMKLQLEQQKMENDLQISRMKANSDMQIASEQAEIQKQMATEKHSAEMQHGYEAHTHKLGMEREAHGSKLERETEAHRTKVAAEQEQAKLRVEEHNAKHKPPKPAPRKVKFVRGKDGKVEGAEIQD